MKDFSLVWPVLTRYGEQEEIMKRLALYMDWNKVEEPEQADLLLEHYQKDVGRLIRTLTFSRTPSPEMAAAVMEMAEKHSEPVSAALRVMFFIFRLMNMAQGIPLSRDEAITPEEMARLLEIAMGLIEQSAMHPGKLPCTECYEWYESIPDLLAHMSSAHPHLNEGDRNMTPQENESNGGETQAEASSGVKTHDQVVAEAKEAEAKQALADAEGATAEDASGDEGEPDKTSEPAPESDVLEEVGGDGPPEPGPDAPESDEAVEDAGRPEPASDAPATEMGAGSNGDADEEVEEDVGEPDTQDEVETPRVDETVRANCLALIVEMHDVTSRNHMKPQGWWDERLGALREFITSV